VVEAGLAHGLGVAVVPTTYVHQQTVAEPGMRGAVRLRLSVSSADVEVEEALGWQGCQMRLFLDCQAETSEIRRIFQHPQSVAAP
jgi:hypothetical protein